MKYNRIAIIAIKWQLSLPVISAYISLMPNLKVDQTPFFTKMAVINYICFLASPHGYMKKSE